MLWKRGKDHRGNLDRPREITSDDGAVEGLSAWLLSDGRNTVILKPEAWPDPAIWGMLLADVALHIANALTEWRGEDAARILARIREGLVIELGDPTDTPAGRWVDRSE